MTYSPTQHDHEGITEDGSTLDLNVSTDIVPNLVGNAGINDGSNPDRRLVTSVESLDGETGNDLIFHVGSAMCRK